MEVVVKLSVNEGSVPEGKDINSYLKEELGWLEESGITPQAILPSKTENEMFETYFAGRNELLDNSVFRIINMFRYTGVEDDKCDRDMKHIGNVEDMICEYIEQEMKAEVCRPFKGGDGTPCYKTEDCEHPFCIFRLRTIGILLL